MIIILTIVLGSSFLSGANNALVENVEIEIVKKKAGADDKLLDSPVDLILFSGLLLLFKNIPIQHSYSAYYCLCETILAPFKPPRSLLTA